MLARDVPIRFNACSIARQLLPASINISVFPLVTYVQLPLEPENSVYAVIIIPLIMHACVQFMALPIHAIVIHGITNSCRRQFINNYCADLAVLMEATKSLRILLQLLISELYSSCAIIFVSTKSSSQYSVS